MLMLLLGGCGGNGEGGGQADNQDDDTPLRALLVEQGLTGDPTVGRTITDINDPEAQLGMKLFYSKALGGSKDTACVSCHHPMLGGGDGLSLSIGANALEPDLLGPGRTHRPDAPDYWLGSPTVPRNAPTTFNVALYTGGMFWDSRVEAAEGGVITPDSRYSGGFSSQLDGKAVDIVSAQARFPVTSRVEMKGHAFEALSDREAVREHLAARIGDYGIGRGELVDNRWRAEFERVYGAGMPVEQLITFERIVQAIGSYERSQVFVDTPWKAYVQGDALAISSAAKRGALLFLRTREQGGANCIACHTGDFFTDEQFHVVAMPQVGRGRGDGPRLNDDYGRYKVTGREEDRYAFRTPTLLNVAVTGPWGHAGSYTSLEEVVRHYIDPELALQEYDYGQLDPLIPVADTQANTLEALEVLKRNREAGILTVENVALSDRDVRDIVAFLHTLTDPCVTQRACLAPWIPDTASAGPDGLQLNAYDAGGNKF
jgi:cytochrome c peroxidase